MKPTRVVILRPDLMLPPKPRTFGLGDAVAKVAQPIARAIDAVAGTKVSQCGACSQRQAALNALVPDLLKPFKH